MNQFKDFGINVESPFCGEKIKVSKILNKLVVVKDYKINESKFEKSNNDKCLCLQIDVEGENRILFSGSKILINQIQRVDRSMLPFTTMIVKENEHFEFR